MINNKVVVFTSGTWDLFHTGHLNILKKSKKLGDILIVGVSTNQLVKSYKTESPIVNYAQRAQIVRSCKYVDKVIKQSTLVDIKILKKYKVDIITIGSDWKGKHLDGLEYMKVHGKVIYLPYTTGVSTNIIKKSILKKSFNIIKSMVKRDQV